MNLSSKLIIQFLFIQTCVFIVLFIIIPSQFKNQALDVLSGEISNLTRMTAYIVSVGLEFGDDEAVQKAIQPLLFMPEIEYVIILDQNGKQFITYNPENIVSVELTTPDQPELKSGVFHCMTPVTTVNGLVVGKLILGYSTSTMAQETSKSRNQVFVVGIILLLMTSLVSYLFSRRVTRYLASVQENVDSLIEGDLTRQVSVNRKDELAKLAISINKMTDRTGELIRDLTNITRQVIAATEKILGLTERLTRSTQMQADEIRDTRQIMETIDTLAEEMSRSSESVFKMMQHVKLLAQDGNKNVKLMIEMMNSIYVKNQVSQRRIDTLKDRTSSLEEILDIVTNISNETKLIALNAAIETSPESPPRKGFRIIADKVKHLTENTVHSIERIREILNAFHETIDDLNIAFKEECDQINHGLSLAEASGDSLNEIFQTVSETTKSVQRITKSTEHQHYSFTRVVDSFKSLSSYVDKIVDSSQSIQIEITQLKRLCDTLSKDISRFKV